MVVESSDPEDIYQGLLDEIEKVLIGKEDIVECLTISVLTKGHVLLEGVPGIAKTTIANLFARATGLRYNRIQMTPDVLPADIVGTHVYREKTGEFSLQKGPVFANLVVADEINRATPKTQSALLEAMQERNVTIEGETLDLPTPFMVVATQNPLESEGVFELPEAQRDRFQFKLKADLPDRKEETKLLDRFDKNPDLGPENITKTISQENLLEGRKHVSNIYVDKKIKQYILDIIESSRENPDIQHGGSPRASIALLNTSKARAAIHGRNYVIPDDIKSLVYPTLIHRLILTTEAELSDIKKEDIIRQILETVEPPSIEEIEKIENQ